LKNPNISIDNIDAFVFDFDGVLTNNLVHIDQEGKEWVSCSRSDGLGFDVLRKLQKPSYILSTEKNPVVKARAKKLKIEVLHGVQDKSKGMRLFVKQKNLDLRRIFYVGNDLNDYHVMQLCGYTACPYDSHQMIKKISNIVLKTSGGNGIVREILEDVFMLNLIKILYPEQETE